MHAECLTSTVLMLNPDNDQIQVQFVQGSKQQLIFYFILILNLSCEHVLNLLECNYCLLFKAMSAVALICSYLMMKNEKKKKKSNILVAKKKVTSPKPKRPSSTFDCYVDEDAAVQPVTHQIHDHRTSTTHPTHSQSHHI